MKIADQHTPFWGGQDGRFLRVKGTPKGEICGGTAMTAYEIEELRKSK